MPITNSDADFAEPFATLLDTNIFTLKREFEKKVRDTKNGQSESDAHFSLHDIITTQTPKKTRDFFSAGLSKEFLVREAGLEPARPIGH